MVRLRATALLTFRTSGPINTGWNAYNKENTAWVVRSSRSGRLTDCLLTWADTTGPYLSRARESLLLVIGSVFDARYRLVSSR